MNEYATMAAKVDELNRNVEVLRKHNLSLLQAEIEIRQHHLEHLESSVKPPNYHDTAYIRQLNDVAILRGVLSLKKGNLVYKTPERMKITQTDRVVARLASGKVSIDLLNADMLADQTHKVNASVTPISPRMKMTLKSADFDITPLSTEEQIVGDDSPTTWEWDIIPKHSGTLHLHLAAIVEIQETVKDFTAIDRVVSVEVTKTEKAADFLKANWQWLFTTLTGGVGIAIWKALTVRRTKDKASDKTDAQKA